MFCETDLPCFLFLFCCFVVFEAVLKRFQGPATISSKRPQQRIRSNTKCREMCCVVEVKYKTLPGVQLLGARASAKTTRENIKKK